MFDPQYDSYACMCRRASGVVKLVKLNDDDWSVPREEFRAAFSPRTKMVLVNTPHNPTGTLQKCYLGHKAACLCCEIPILISSI